MQPIAVTDGRRAKGAWITTASRSRLLNHSRPASSRRTARKAGLPRPGQLQLALGRLEVMLSGGTYSSERPSGKDGAVKSALNRREFNGLCGALCSFVASSGALALDAATAVALNGTAQTVKFRDATVVPAIGQGSARIGQGRHPAAEEEEA